MWASRALATWLLAGLLAGAAQAQALRDESALFDKPDGVAQGGRLKATTPVKLLKRQGFWLEVEAAGRVGWLKVSAVSFAGASGSVAIDTGRLGGGNIVATSVARGLSAKDLLEGKPDHAEAARLEALAVDPSAVTGFRAQGGLQSVAGVGALSAPRGVTPASAGTGNPVGDRVPGSAVPAQSPAAARKKGDDDW